jgi:hypothetical protein
MNRKLLPFFSLVMVAAIVLSGCAAPAPQVIEKIVTQVTE